MSPPAATPSRLAGPGARPAGSPRLTSRAAVLAVVICAITLSLAYPVREYIAQRRQIDQLVAEQVAAQTQVRSLQAEQQRLTDPAYVEQQAEDRLGYCFPTEKCYVIVGGQVAPDTVQAPLAAPDPWYAKVWRSVKQADSPK